MLREWKRIALAALIGLAVTGCAGNTMNAESKDAGEKPFDLSRYSKVLLEPVEVKFDERWDPTETGTNIAQSAEERERVRRQVADLFDKVFAEELTAGGKVELVDQPGRDVLYIKPVLIDVYLHAPLSEAARPRQIFTRSIGEVTLNAVMRDSISGKQLLELHDVMRGRDLGLIRPANPAFNRFELSRIFRDWAQVIRQEVLGAP